MGVQSPFFNAMFWTIFFFKHKSKSEFYHSFALSFHVPIYIYGTWYKLIFKKNSKVALLGANINEHKLTKVLLF